jgi:FtsH-binding integral membrane protein
MRGAEPDPVPVTTRIEYGAKPDASTGSTLPRPPVTPEANSAPASAIGNWFGKLSLTARTLISAALAVLALTIPFFFPGTPAVFFCSMAGLLGVIAVVARTQRRRSLALLVAVITGVIAFSLGWMFTYAPPRDALAAFASTGMLLFPLGFVAAWSIARRNRSGGWIGLLLAAPLVIGVQMALPPGGPMVLVVAWGIPTVLGCAVAWCVDLAASKIGQNKSQTGGV